MKRTIIAVVVAASLSLVIASQASAAIPGYPVTPDPADFGTVRVGQSSAAQTLTLENGYAVPVPVVQVSLLDSTNLSISNNHCDGVTLQPLGTCTFDVTFNPQASGHVISSTALETQWGYNPSLSTIEGNGVEPVVELYPASIGFGDQTVGKSSNDRFVLLYNNGTGALAITSITADAPFSVTSNNCPSSLPSKYACAFRVVFTPTAAGAASGNATVTDDATGSPHTVPLTGTGVTAPQPHASLSSTEIDFGGQLVGTTSAAEEVTLKNTGTLVLNISSIAATGDFAVTSDCGATLAVDASCTLSTTFSPTAVGTAAGAVTITDDASDSPQTITLHGHGTAHTGPKASLSTSAIDFGFVVFNTLSSVQSYTLENTGDEDLVVDDIGITGENSDYFATESDCLTTLQTGESCSGDVIFFPYNPEAYLPAPIDYAAAIEVTDNTSDSPQTITLSGTGVVSLPGGTGCSLAGAGPASFAGGAALFMVLSAGAGLMLARRRRCAKR